MSNINTGMTNIPIPDSAYARWRRCKELSYYTAWQQTQPRNYRNPTPNEEILNKEAVLMLTLIAALDYCIYDLIEEMEEVGKYRHGTSVISTRRKTLSFTLTIYSIAICSASTTKA